MFNPCLAYTPNKVTIGVYISSMTIKKLNEQKQAKDTIMELINANRKVQTTLFFFCYKDIDLEMENIRGTYFDEQQKIWKTTDFPYPDVLYGRIRGMDGEKGTSVREALKNRGVKILNAKNAFDKWSMHQKLLMDETVRSHLPLSMLYEEPEDLKIMLDFCQQGVYLKPIKGSKGKKIMKITQQENGDYEYRYFTEDLVVGQVQCFNHLVHTIEDLFKGKKWIVQEAIDHLTINNNMVDFRAEIQRNARGELEIVAIFPRLGTNQSPVTNLRSGAGFFRFDEFVRQNLGFTYMEMKSLRNTIEKFIIKVHDSIENIYGPFGETAIDFTLDKDHKIWFIECNATSTKLAFFEAEADRQIIEKAYRNPLEYAIFLKRK